MEKIMAQNYHATKCEPEGTRLSEMWEILPESSGCNENNELMIGGVAVTELTARFGTPLHIIDDEGLRRQIRRFVEGMSSRWPNSEVLFASKSLPIAEMYKVAEEEGLSVDIAGGGELVLALSAGVSPERIYFHGNAKTDEELRYALRAGVGTIIVDNEDELDRLDRLLISPQRLLLRVIPGIDAHTHASQATGGNNSKFGLPMDQAAHAIQRMRVHPLMQFEGVHLHIGSQILDTSQFAEAVEKLATSGEYEVYDVGGGLGVKYTYEDEAPSVSSYLDAIVASAKKHLPADVRILIEPGRSIVARAGVTAYSVVSVKQTGKTFVAVDGGMADQLDVALTGQRYEALVANRVHEAWDHTVQLVGRQCESGDLLIDGANFPHTRVGDTVVMATTGAYAYTTSNNYNGALKPPIVFVRDGEARLAVRKETYSDLLALHEPSLSGRFDL